MKRHILIIYTVIFIVSNIYAKKNPDNNTLIGPLKPPYSFSGNFGEIRLGHFHSGLDFRTQGRTGLPVLAVKDGYVSRISISLTGYGNALFLNHPDGTTTVYGHLERFQPEVQNYLKENQYNQESFQINLKVPPKRFSYNRGDTIAWSGNSGSSEGPHLHFEIRDTESEEVLNPFLSNFGIIDKSTPSISAIYIYQFDNFTGDGQVSNKKKYEVAGAVDCYKIKNNLPITVNQSFGVGVQAEDDINGSGLKVGIYSALLKYNGIEVFGFKMKNFSFNNTRFANAQVDYEEFLKNHHKIQRLFKLPGNDLNLYDPLINNGIINFPSNKTVEIELIIGDAFNNKTKCKFKVQLVNQPAKAKKQNLNTIFHYDQLNEFHNDLVKLEIPKGALYSNLDFNYKMSSKKPGLYSDIHQIHTKYIPLHKNCTLSIKGLGIPGQLSNKSIIVMTDQSGKVVKSIGGTFSRGWVTAETNSFGFFSIAIDKTPPSITPLSIKEKKILTDQQKIEFRIEDDLSGIKSYRGELDGKWILFEMDTKKGIIAYKFDKERIELGKSHLLRLVVSDNKDNISEYKAIIYK